MNGIQLRPATFGDAEAVASVQWQTWQSAYLGILPHEILVGFGQSQDAAFWQRILQRGGEHEGVLLAELDQEVVGFLSCGPIRGRLDGFAGEFYALYVVPEAQGCGIGTALMSEAAKTLIRRRWSSAAVWVLEENHFGRRFYERLGGSPLGVAKPLAYRGRTYAAIREIAYGWPDLRRAAWMADEPNRRG